MITGHATILVLPGIATVQMPIKTFVTSMMMEDSIVTSAAVRSTGVVVKIQPNTAPTLLPIMMCVTMDIILCMLHPFCWSF